MPKPKIMQNKTNKAGKIYPWMIEGKDFAAYKSVDLFINFVQASARILGENEHKYVASQTNELNDNLVDNNEFEKEEADKVLGVVYKGLNPQIRLADINVMKVQSYSFFLTDDQFDKADEIYNDIKKINDRAADEISARYIGKTDARSRDLKAKADRYADMIRLAGEALDPERGNMMKAEMDSPTLATLNNIMVSMPRFEEKGFESCADTMGPIYDDYMTMVSAGFNETLIQYHRQEMELDGWDGDKERTYLHELRLSHQKIVEAFDRLWQVDNKGQYDPALGNTLVSMVGNDPGEHRDMNSTVGMLRGEVRAIDMGYDSKHLYILGMIGQQEQAIKKLEAEIDFVEKSGSKEEIENIQEKKKSLGEYKAEFKKIKDEVWDRHVDSLEDMNAVEKQVDDFFKAHQEKYAAFQDYTMKEYEMRLDYNREIAADEKELVTTPTLLSDDLEEIMNIQNTASLFMGNTDESINIQGKLLETFSKAAGNTHMEDGPKRGYLVDSYDKEVKDLAKEVIGKFDEYKNRESRDIAHPGVEAFKDILAEYAKFEAEMLRDGIHINASKTQNENLNRSFKSVQSLMPQLTVDLTNPEKADLIEAGLKEFPLDKFVEMGIDLQRMQNELTQRGAGMTDAEKQNIRLKMEDKERDMLELSKDLKEKTKNPTEAAMSLFGSKEYLVADYQFAGVRGVGSLIPDLEESLAKTEIPDSILDTLNKGLEDFNKKPTFSLFSKESDLHAQIREGFESVKENLDKLKSGKIIGEDGNERFMTSEEKLDLITETQEKLNKLGESTREFGKAEKNETRLKGAQTLADVINDLQDTLMDREQHIIAIETMRAGKEYDKNNPDKTAENDKIAESAKKSKDDFDVKPARTKISLDDLEAEEKPEKSARKSLTKAVNMNKSKEKQKDGMGMS